MLRYRYRHDWKNGTVKSMPRLKSTRKYSAQIELLEVGVRLKMEAQCESLAGGTNATVNKSEKESHPGKIPVHCTDGQ
jgi:hypothetical protein